MPEAAVKASPAAASAPLLTVRGLEGWYGESHVLHGIDLDVKAGEVVTLLGRNGAGKTTTLRAIIGILGRRAGSIAYDGVETIAMASRKIAKLGIGYVPEERGIFSSLTVQENLMLPPRVKPGGMSVAEIHTLFPNLKERAGSQGTKLSGGEQQMLAFGRALVLNPKLLLLDEPLEGLAPLIVQELLQAIRRVAREEGLPSIVVEQHPHMVLAVTDDALVLDRGGVAYRATSAALLADPAPLDTWLGVSSRH